jgi:NTE family protein
VTRIGLVLGAGGILGSAWTTGALVSLAQRLDRPLGEVDLVLGTSAGSVHGAALRCGMTVDELVAHQRGVPPAEIAADLDGGDLPDMRTLERESGDGLPPVPLPWIGSPRLLASAAAHPMRMNPMIAASGLLPAGRAQMSSLVRMVVALQNRMGATSDGWVPGAPLWVAAVDYDSGRRVVFGPRGRPALHGRRRGAGLVLDPRLVRPAGDRRAPLRRRRVASSTSVALLARPGAPALDEVYVLAPLASHAYDRPLDPVACLERAVRHVITRWLDAEVRAVRATGARVTVLTPGPADLAAMGANLMNPRRRCRVLDTALETSAVALAEVGGSGQQAA